MFLITIDTSVARGSKRKRGHWDKETLVEEYKEICQHLGQVRQQL